ncbi:MAG: hypothetical protein ACLGGX_00650 [Bdellovibrionia bacterium]
MEEGIDLTLSYGERRTATGAYFSVFYETQEFPKYLSTLDNSTYKDKYGAGISLMGINWLKKYNFEKSSLSIGLGYGLGSTSKGDAEMSLEKIKLSSRFAVDRLGKEAHWVPFVGFELWQLNITEKSSTDSFSGKIEMGYQYALGLSIQISRLDPSSSSQAYAEWGLENTFIDVYLFGNGEPLSGEEANVSNEMQTGFALTLEF